MSRADKALEKFDSRSSKLADGFSKGFMGMAANTAKYVGAGAAAVLGFSTKVGMGFEAAMSEVESISGATGKDLEDLTAKAREMGSSTNFSASEAAAGLKYMALAGWDTEQMVSGLPGILHLAGASGMELASASDIVTDTLTMFGMQAEEAGKAADIFTQTQNKSNTSVSQLGEAMKYAGSAAAASNMSLEQTNAVLGVFANGGLKGSMAGTTFAATLKDIKQNATDGAIAVGDTSIAVYDAQGNFRDLGTIMAEVEDATQGMTGAQRDAALSAIFGEQALKGVNIMLKQGKGAYKDLEDQIINSTGAAEEAYDKMTDNLKGDWDEFKSAVEEAGLSVYQMSGGPLRALVQKATEIATAIGDTIKAFDAWTQKLSKLDNTAAKIDMVKKAMEPFLPLLATIGGGFAVAFTAPALVRLPGLFNGVTKAMSGMTGPLNTAIRTISAFGSHFSTVFSKVTGIIPGFSGALSKGMNVGMGVLGQSLNTMQTLVHAALSVIGPAAIAGLALAGLGLVYSQFGDQIDQMINMAVEKGPQIITSLAEGIASKIPDLVSKGTELIAGFTEVVTANLPALVQGGISIIASLIEGVTSNMSSLMASAIQIITTLATSLLSALPQLIVIGMNVLLSLVQGLLDNMDLLISSAQNIMTSLTGSITENLPMIIETGIAIMLGLVNALVQGLPQLIPIGVQAIGTLIEAISSNLPQLLQGGILVVMTLIQGILQNLPMIIDSGLQLISSLIHGLVQNLPMIISTGLQLIAMLVVTLISNLPAIAQAGFELIVGLGSAMLEAIPAALSAVWDGIKTGFSNVWDWVTGKNKEGGAETKATLDDVSNHVNTTTSTMATNAGINAEQTKSNVTTEFNSMGSSLDQLLSNMQTNSDGAWSKIEAGSSKFSALSKSNVVTEYSGMQSDGNRILSQLEADSKSTFSNIESNSSSKSSSIKSSVTSNISEMGQQATNDIKGLETAGTQGFTQLGSNVDKATNQMQQSVTKNMDATSKSFENSFKQMEQTADNGLKVIEQGFNKANQQINQNTSQTFTNLVNTVTQSMSNMQNVMNSAFNAILQQAQSTGQQTVAAFSSIIGQMSSAGYNAGMGFYSGLAGTAGSIYALANSIANNVATTIRRALAIRSPSRVMIAAGKDTGEGFVIGLESKAKPATKAMEKSLKSVLSKKDEYIALLKEWNLDDAGSFEKLKKGGVEAFGELASTIQTFVESEGAELTDLAGVFGDVWTKELYDIVYKYSEWDMANQKMILSLDDINKEYSKLSKASESTTRNIEDDFNRATKEMVKFAQSHKGEMAKLFNDYGMGDQFEEAFAKIKAGGSEALEEVVKRVSALRESGAYTYEIMQAFGDGLYSLGREWDAVFYSATEETDNLTDAVKYLRDEYKRTTESVKSNAWALEGVLEGAYKHVLEHGDEMEAMAKKFDIAWDKEAVFETLKRGGTEAFAQLISDIALFAEIGAETDDLLKGFGDTFNFLGDEWGSTIFGMLEDSANWEEAIKKINDAYFATEVAGTDAVASIGASTEQMVTAQTDAILYMMDTLKNEIQWNKDEFISAMQEIGGHGLDEWENIIHGGTGANGVLAAVIGQIMKMRDETERSALIAKVFGSEWNQALVDSMLTFGKWESEMDVGSWALDNAAMMKHFEDELAKATKSTTENLEKVAGKAKEVKEKLAGEELVTAMTDTIMNALVENAGKGMDKLREVITAGLESVLNEFKVKFDEVGSVVSDVLNKSISDAAEKGMSTLEQVTTDGLNTISKGFEDAFDKISNNVASKMRDRVQKEMETTMFNLDKNIGNVLSNISNRFNVAYDSIANKISTAMSFAHNQTASILSRMNNDIQSFSYNAISAINQMVVSFSNAENQISNSIARMQAKMNSEITINGSGDTPNRQPAHVVLELGGTNYKTFIEDINNGQSRVNRLVEDFGV